MLKLFVLCCIPYLCQGSLHIQEDLSILQTQTLSSVMHLITHALPSISGMGPAEFSFLLLFSPYLGENSTATLLLYRVITYYVQFIIGAVVFFHFSCSLPKRVDQAPESIR